jgi:ubiquinone/menaquinone biosynthesis C-methylase UbiE
MADVGRGFDRLAGIYDGLARLVYGKSIRRVQTEFLSEWPKNARVLIVGGGTGWFLEEVLKKAEPAAVTCLDISGKMLEKSQSRIAARQPQVASRVAYVQGTIRLLLPPPENPVAKRYDVVVTHFYLDMFNGAELQQEIAALKKLLKPGGLWSLADFAYAGKGLMRPVSRIMVGSMYLFFRIAAGINSKKLEDYPTLLEHAGFSPLKSAKHYRGMMVNGLYAHNVE